MEDEPNKSADFALSGIFSANRENISSNSVSQSITSNSPQMFSYLYMCWC